MDIWCDQRKLHDVYRNDSHGIEYIRDVSLHAGSIPATAFVAEFGCTIATRRLG